MNNILFSGSPRFLETSDLPTPFGFFAYYPISDTRICLGYKRTLREG